MVKNNNWIWIVLIILSVISFTNFNISKKEGIGFSPTLKECNDERNQALEVVDCVGDCTLFTNEINQCLKSKIGIDNSLMVDRYTYFTNNEKCETMIGIQWEIWKCMYNTDGCPPYTKKCQDGTCKENCDIKVCDTICNTCEKIKYTYDIKDLGFECDNQDYFNCIDYANKNNINYYYTEKFDIVCTCPSGTVKCPDRICKTSCGDGTCIGSSTQTCIVGTCTGTQSRDCNKGVWGSWRTCTKNDANCGATANKCTFPEEGEYPDCKISKIVWIIGGIFVFMMLMMMKKK